MSSVKVNNNSQSQKLAEAKQWYVRKNFSSAYIKKFQSVVGTNADGIVGKNTINSVISWQSKNNLVSDGKFGQSCAAKAGIAYNSSKPSNNASQSNANGISSQKRAEAKRWYDRKIFSSTYIKSFQKVVGTSADGIVGNNTIDSVISWQSKYGLESDGKFGQSCAAKAGIQYNERPANYASQNNAPTGKGINPKPRFQKQYDYKTLPYVEQRHYNEMKSAMGGTNFASWDINSSKISSIYKRARSANGNDASTISSSGCGAASYANVKGISIPEAAKLSMEENCRVYNSGTSGRLFSNHGGTAASKDASTALNSVANGKYLVASMGPGNWTSYGHFILVYGFANNSVYVSDPASSKQHRAVGTKKQFVDSYKYGYLF